MKNSILFAVIVVLVTLSISSANTPNQQQGSLVVSENSQAMRGAGGFNATGTLAGDTQSQNQRGCGWRQSQCSGTVIGQAGMQAGGYGCKIQNSCIGADLNQSQRFARCAPKSQSQSLVLEGQQGSKMSGSGGMSGQLNGAAAGQNQSQAARCNWQNQSQTAGLLQVSAQQGPCFGSVCNNQNAGVYTNQEQHK